MDKDADDYDEKLYIDGFPRATVFSVTKRCT